MAEQNPNEQPDPNLVSDSPPPEGAANAEAPLDSEAHPLAAKLEELTAALQRERADFQNFRKRVERENEQLKSRLGGDILGKFLPVLDDFQRAMDSLPAEQRESDWLKGFHLIFRKFQAIVEAEGVTEINPLGQAFDPNLHEAIGTDDDSPYESQQVSAVLQRGYRQGERVLRPAMVRVAS